MAEVNRSKAKTKAEENRLRLIRIGSKKVLNGSEAQTKAEENRLRLIRIDRRCGSDWYCGCRLVVDVDRTGIDGDRRCMSRLNGRNLMQDSEDLAPGLGYLMLVWVINFP
ncbi:hypothetical protein FCV25MIE_17385 [Fagus crenata]